MTDPRGRLAAVGRWLFGDRSGLVLWLALLCWFGVSWRIGFFITDSYAMANTLVALTDGQLHVSELRYSLTFGSQPGLYEYAGRAYGRNYGMLALALPLVWALEGLSAVAAPRLVLAGLWAGVGLVLVTQVAELDRFGRDQTRAVGAVLVTLLFAASVLTATDLAADRLALVALQLSTVLIAATAGLVLYRLVALLHGRRAGLAAGLVVGVATPIGFWATLPKRHTLVATLVLGTVYAFAVSRHREGDAALRARAGAYALAGYITSVHAFEALFVVVVLGGVDLLTARDRSPRALAVVGLVLLVASTPMLATNYAISGNPATPPRLLAGIDTEFSPSPDGADAAGPTPAGAAGTPTPGGGTGTPTPDGATGTPTSDGATGTPTSDGATGTPAPAGAAGTPAPAGATGTPPPDGAVGTPTPGGTTDTRATAEPTVPGTPTPAGGDSGRQPLSSPFEVVSGAVDTVAKFAGRNLAGGLAVLTQPDRLWHTFVRDWTLRGGAPGSNEYEAIDLTVLEAMPLLAGLAALPLLAWRRLRTVVDRGLSAVDPRNWRPSSQTDMLVVALAAALTVVYLPRLPTHTMLTARYLHPVIALGAYGIWRVPAVRTAALVKTRWLVGSYLASLGVALAVLLGGVVGLELAVGEAVQYNALWNLFAAAVCALAVVGWTVTDRVPDRAVAVGLALPAGFTTAYLLCSALVYFRYGSYAFDLIGLAAESLPAL